MTYAAVTLSRRSLSCKSHKRNFLSFVAKFRAKAFCQSDMDVAILWNLQGGARCAHHLVSPLHPDPVIPMVAL